MQRQVTLVNNENICIKTLYCLGKACHMCPFRFKCYTESRDTFAITSEELDTASFTCISGNKLLELFRYSREKIFCKADVTEMTFREITKEGYFVTDRDKNRLASWEQPKYMKEIKCLSINAR